MKQFNDSKGRAWSVEFTVSAVKRIRGLCDFDPLDGEALQGLASNPVLLVDVLFATIQPQAETQNVTDEEFGAAMGGEAIAHATEALIDEIVNFIRQTDPSKGKFITRSMEKYREVNARVAQHAINILDTPAIDDAIERQIQKVETDMAKILEPSSGG
tara:strand:- start:500 stop:973 length:474 start_codon:yes stop_codon:yes gene_type:complete